MRQLDAQEGGGVGGDGPRQGRAEAGKEGPDAALGVQLADDAADGDVALGGLQARLDGVDGEDGDPHGDSGGGTGAGDGGQAELAAGLAGGRVDGGQAALDVLVGGEVCGAPGPVAGQGCGAAAEDGAHAALAVQLAHDVQAAVVARLLARGEALVLDLQDDLYALEGGGDGGHRDGGEEARGRDLGNGEGAVGGGLGRAADDGLAQVVAPEGDGDCARDSGQYWREKGGKGGEVKGEEGG